MFEDFFKRNSLILVFSIICLGLIVTVLFQLDKQYYQNAKKEIISNNDYYQAVTGEDMYLLMARALEQMRSGHPKPEPLREPALKILEKPGIIWRIAIQPPPLLGRGTQATGHEQYLIDIAREDKLRGNNQFSNSLLLKDFSGKITLQIQDEDTARTNYGRLILYYTTPLGKPEIEELTTLYRWYCAFFVLISALLAYTAARRLLVPIRNVTSAIDGSTPARTVFIGRTHSRLENLYNRLALDAVIARLQGQIRDEIARRPQMTGWEVVQFIGHAFSDQLTPTLLGGIEMIAEGPGRIRATSQAFFFIRPPLHATPEVLQAQIDPLMPRDGRTTAPFALPEADPPIEGALHLIPDPERSGIRYLFALGLDARLHESEALSLSHMLGRLADLVESGLQTLSLRNQILVQERGRANISLSRNLGHDLTNIIATSKLELMALDRLLGGGRPPEDPRRRQILLESLHGLLRSVRFMQETVNLYRAYAFLQHPMLEIHDGNELAGTTLDLFAMSTSTKVELRRELAEGAPRCVVDPRLIKLALFNLFANALEAIRKTENDSSFDGWIRVRTERSPAGGLRIAIEDSGTGILNADGERAETHEIEKIFELGYTSHRAGGGQGEGLGLNWVRQIVQDLHGGTIIAENIPGEGARFILTFPPIPNSRA